MIYIYSLEGTLLDEGTTIKICDRYNITMEFLESLLREQIPYKGKIFQANDEFFDFSTEADDCNSFGILQELEDFIRNGNNLNQVSYEF